MLGIKFVNIADNERALLFRKNSFKKILEPGSYRIMNFLNNIRVDVYDITETELKHDLGKFLVTTYGEQLKSYINSFDIKENEVGLVYEDGKLTDIIEPGNFKMFWKGSINVEVKIIDIKENYEVDQKFLALLVRNKNNIVNGMVERAIFYIELPDNYVGLLKVNGKLEKQLKTGSYGYWNFNRNVDVKVIDCRLQTMEVSGQEILTKDRVSLRVNLSASYRVVDTVKAATLLGNYKDFLYREFQLAVREVVGMRTLDQLLVDKEQINTVVEKSVQSKSLEYGIQVQDIGMKDIVLPGEMREILNQVVEAQKAAEANLIKRREETQATRSLHNTAKMMEGNAILMRLKELEALERVTESIDNITVYGGLEGVMKDMVKIQPVLNNQN